MDGCLCCIYTHRDIILVRLIFSLCYNKTFACVYERLWECVYVKAGDTMTCRTCEYDSKLITAASEDGRLRCQSVSHADVRVDMRTYKSVRTHQLRLSRTSPSTTPNKL